MSDLLTIAQIKKKIEDWTQGNPNLTSVHISAEDRSFYLVYNGGMGGWEVKAARDLHSPFNEVIEQLYREQVLEARGDVATYYPSRIRLQQLFWKK